MASHPVAGHHDRQGDVFPLEDLCPQLMGVSLSRMTREITGPLDRQTLRPTM